MVLEPGRVGIGFGEKLTVEGAGLPLADSVTAPLKPPVEPALMVTEAGVPAQTEVSAGVGASVKPGSSEQPGNLKLPMRVRQLNDAVVP